MASRLRGVRAAGNTLRGPVTTEGKTVTASPPTLILTRPEAQSHGLAAACRRRFGEDLPILISPVLEIEILPVARALEDYPTLVFTSSNGVAAVAERGGLSNGRAYCVGERTAEAAQELGLEVVQGPGTSEALIARIIADRPAGPILHIRGEHARGDVAGSLAGAGLMADETVAYRQIARRMSEAAVQALTRQGVLIFPLFSPRSAALVSATARAGRAPMRVAAISAATAEAWTAPAERIDVAAHPDAASMMDAIGRLLGR
jgi:uroporphyrinogen-III synthase